MNKQRKGTPTKERKKNNPKIKASRNKPTQRRRTKESKKESSFFKTIVFTYLHHIY